MRAIYQFFLAMAFLSCGILGYFAGMASVGIMTDTGVIDKRITDERTKTGGNACIEVCDIPKACFDDALRCMVGCVTNEIK